MAIRVERTEEEWKALARMTTFSSVRSTGLWEPKKVAEACAALHTEPYVHHPPCDCCKHWSPRLVTDAYGNTKTVRCCIAKRMQSDFSCFSVAPNAIVGKGNQDA